MTKVILGTSNVKEPGQWSAENEPNYRGFLLPSISVPPWTSPLLKQGNNTREFLTQGKQGLKKRKRKADWGSLQDSRCVYSFSSSKKIIIKKRWSNRRSNGCLGKAECCCSLRPSLFWCIASVLLLLKRSEIWWYPAGWLDQSFSLKIKLQGKICTMGKWKQ